MRRILYFVACSLDGYIAGSDDDISWLFTEGDYGYQEFYDSIDTTLTGRITYDLILNFEEFPYPGKKNYVFTREKSGLTYPEAETVSGDIVEFVRNLKKEKGKNIWLVGGGKLAAVLESAGLIDDYIISVHPILLGTGKPLFHGISINTRLQLTSCVSFPSGLVQLRYSSL